MTKAMQHPNSIVAFPALALLTAFALVGCKPPEQQSSSSMPTPPSSSSSSSSPSSSSSSSSSQASTPASSPSSSQGSPTQQSGQEQQTASPSQQGQTSSTPDSDSSSSSSSQASSSTQQPGQEQASAPPQQDQTNSTPGSDSSAASTQSSQQQGADATSGQMTDDEILAGAMEVFNRSMQTGLPDSTTPGQQPETGSMEGMDGTNTAQGAPADAGNGNNETGQPSSSSGTATDSSADNGTLSTGEAGNGGDIAGADTTGTQGSYGAMPGQTDTDTAAVSGTMPGASGNGQSTSQTRAGSGQGGTLTDGSVPQGGINDATAGRRIIIVGSGSGTQTEDERVGNLDRELEEKMAVFDGIILGRRQDVIAGTNEQQAGTTIPAATGSGTGSDEGSGTAPLLTASRDPNDMRTQGRLPDAEGDNRTGDFQNQEDNNANIPDDIPDGSDDDIVARQLREAAMQEQNPELREKLWDEYRKYKTGVQASR